MPQCKDDDGNAMVTMYLRRQRTKRPHAERDAQLVEGVLSSLALFRGVAEEAVRSVARHAYPRPHRRADLICARGTRMPGVVAVAYGSAKMSLRREGHEEKVVRLVSAHECFGEASALHDRPAPADLIAIEETVTVVIPPLPLLALLEHNPVFARNLVREISNKLVGLLGDLQASAQLTALERLAGYLSGLARPGGRFGAWMATLPTSKTVIAARLGMTKETMSRLLRELARRGFITVEGRAIEVRDPAALSDLAR